jgi:hypothetical protein
MSNTVLDKIDNYMEEMEKKHQTNKAGKEVKFLYVTEEEQKSAEYQAYFKKMLKKYGVDEPDKIPEKDRKKFYDEVDKGWKAKKETD